MQACANNFWEWFLSASWIEWAKTLVDLLKGVAWPATILLVVWLFRDEIKKQIPRLKEAGPTGFSFVDEGQPTTAPGPGQLTTADHPLETVNTLAVQISEELSAYVADQREPRLIRALAEARTLANFEFIFANIFRSQVMALQVLEEGPVTTEAAEEYFAKEVIPLNKELFEAWGFEKWSAYLVSQRLVHVEGGMVAITAKGRDFLEFVRQHKGGFVLAN